MGERKSSAATTWVILFDEQQGTLYMHIPTCRIAHNITFVTPVVEFWLEQEIWLDKINSSGSTTRD